MQQKSRFNKHFEAMQGGKSRPSFKPMLLLFDSLKCWPDLLKQYPIDIAPCAFCHGDFEPALDCLIISCHHAYHLWCALMHFSSSTICCVSTCLQEVHSDWWDLVGVKKLEDKLPEGRGRCHSERVNAHHQEQQGICCLLLNSFDFVLNIW